VPRKTAYDGEKMDLGVTKVLKMALLELADYAPGMISSA
jgi:hypothetical protein